MGGQVRPRVVRFHMPLRIRQRTCPEWWPRDRSPWTRIKGVRVPGLSVRVQCCHPPLLGNSQDANVQAMLPPPVTTANRVFQWRTKRCALLCAVKRSESSRTARLSTPLAFLLTAANA